MTKTTLAAALLHVLQTWTPFHLDTETPVERRARLVEFADDVAGAAWERREMRSPVWTAAALLTIAKHESHLAQYVWEGNCSNPPHNADRCDPDKSGKPQSLTVFQLKRRSCPEAHRLPDGSREQHRAAARCAARLFSAAHRRCKGRHAVSDLAGAFSGYGFGIDCTAARSAARASYMRTTSARIWAAVQTEK